MTNKKRLTISILCLLMLIISMFTFSACGGGKVENFNLSFKVDGENYSTISTNGSEVVVIPQNPSKEGYTFEGWYWDKDVWSKPFTANSLLDTPISSDMSVYAKFSAIEYDITYENDGGTHSNPVSYTIEDSFALSVAEKIGYTFVGWYSDAAYTTKVESVSAGSKGAITLYAKFEINNYTISYGNTKDAENNNVTSYNVNTDTITLSDLSKTGYVFEGWYNGEEKVTEIAKGSTGDITLTAKWSVIGYDITYHNVDGATNSNSATYDVEDQPLALSDASKDGYRFLGWYTDAAFTNKVSEIAIGTTGDINLYAKWELIEYTATFMDGTTVVGTVKFTVETESITEPAVPNHVGYTGAWESYTLGTEDITINAVYSLVTYGITYNNVTGATNNNPATYDVEDQPLILAGASKAGYTFEGWYSDAALTNRVTEIAVGTTGPVILYAKWDAIEYTATFKDGNTIVAEIPFTVETESIVAPAVPNHAGYNGAWESYTLGTNDITINAVYTVITYNVTYNNVAGATNTNPATYDVEDQPLVLADASKAYYTFKGWYSDAALTNKVTEIAVGTTGPVTLYAKWEAIEYTITYLYDNAVGDYREGTTVKTTYTVEDEFEFAPLICKTVGYTFDGWFTEKNIGTGMKVNGVTKGMTGDITVYAQFGLEEYDITYNNVNGAINNNPTHYNITTESFTIYPLSNVGYNFDGWFVDEACVTPADLTIDKGSNGDITLWAKWTPITYTIEYVTYGGTATGNPATYIVTDRITFNNATLSGYVFKGWYTAAEGGNKVTEIVAGTTGNIVLYARWNYISTITFNSNGGDAVNSITNEEGVAISAPIAPTKDHYAFAGWYSDTGLTKAYTIRTQPAEDITLYAKWVPVAYEIEYVLNGGTNHENNPKTYTIEDKFELFAPSKTGYGFIGWFTDADFTSSVVTEIKVGTNGKIKLYAHYSINQYTISFDSNGGTSVTPIRQNYATNVTVPVAPAKNGYTFAGWYSDATLNKAYTFTTMPAEDITLYAKWNVATYNITYNLNGGINSSGNPASYTITSATITFKTPTKNGYSFAGWYTDVECTNSITGILSGSYGDVEVFAKWTPTEYTITYIVDDGTINENITKYTIETDLTTLLDASLKGHTFGGWFTSTSYKTAVTTVAGGEIGNKTVYAKFTANTYNVWLDGNEEAKATVSFNLNGGEGTISAQTVTPTVTLKYPTAPTRNGYIFAGWYDNAACNGSTYDFSAVVASDITLFAKWVKIENATAVAINGSANVTINGKDENLLMFVPLVSGNVTITSSGNYDTFGALYNSEMSLLSQDDDNASDGKNFLIVYNVTAGETYYIGARAYSSTTTGTANISISGVNTVLDGGYAITTSKTKITYGTSFTLTLPKARDGYKFLGYADIDGVMYTDTDGKSIRNWDKDEDTILYSAWERMVYTINFETNLGTPIESVQLAYGERVDITRFVTTKEGHVFVCWLLDGKEYNASTMPDHDLTLVANWVKYTVSIKYNTNKMSISVNDTISAELFDAYCYDNTTGKILPIQVQCTVSGNVVAGGTINVRFTAEGYNKAPSISGIKVYGMPTLDFDETVNYVNVTGGMTASKFGASGKDSFGNATEIKVYIDGEYEVGTYVKLIIESIDPAGNITRGYIENVKAYGLPVITYDENKAEISVNDVLSAELFGATAVDSFGEVLSVSVTRYNGTISSGNTVTIRISASDSKGNITNIDVACKVYGTPTISNATTTDVRVSDILTAELLGITAKDTYREAVDVIFTTKSGSQIAGTIWTVTAIAIDPAGNVVTKDIELKVYGAPTITYDRDAIKVIEDARKAAATVSFNLNGGTGNIPSQSITDITGLVYPELPTRSGYVFKGWYTTAQCKTLFDFSQNISGDITLYAGWHKISTSGYGNYVMNVYGDNNSSSDYYMTLTQGTSSSSPKYTYFTVLRSGTYFLYYKNSSVGSTTNKTYLYVYNATQGKAIKSNTAISSTSYDWVSFEAKAGDVIYVRNYRYNTSSNGDYTAFYMYLSGASYPAAGGLLTYDNVLNIKAKDSFGKNVLYSVTVKEGELIGGTNIVYTITATDHLGNTTTIETATMGVYDQSDIKFNRDSFEGITNTIKLSSKGEEFNASAVDSFGQLCDISIEAAEGYTLEGGKTIVLYIVATDKAGNRLVSGPLGDGSNGMKVYDVPTITLKQDNLIIYEDTDIDFLFDSRDSFGEELYTQLSVQSPIIADTIVKIVAKITDDAGNTVEKTYTFGVLPSERYFVELYVDGELWKALFVEDKNNYKLPMPSIDNGMKAEWVSDTFAVYTDSAGLGLRELPQSIKLSLSIYPEGYTPIYTPEQLKNIALDGKYALVQDLNLGNAEWTPLGVFEGIFDGSGHTIYNFKITKRTGYYMGLFSTNKGTIRNLGITDFSMTITPSYGTSHYIGGLVGYNNGGTIENCFARGSIRVSDYTAYIGGLVGYNYKEGTITNCNASVSINGIHAIAGGLAGCNYGTISMSYATGSVYSSSYDSRVGGLVGINSSGAIVENCYATGAVTAYHSESTSTGPNAYAGGLIARNSGTVKNCYATGVVKATCSTGLPPHTGNGSVTARAYAGGLIGYLEGGTIQSCYATGDITAKASASGATTSGSGYTIYYYSYSYAGRLIGYVYNGSVKNCYCSLSQEISAETYCSEGERIELEELLALDFLSETLEWDDDIWSFVNSSNPSLVNN